MQKWNDKEVEENIEIMYLMSRYKIFLSIKAKKKW